MNKKAFIGVTAVAVVTGAVAGAIYYRHTVVEKLDEILTTRFKEGILVKGDADEDPKISPYDRYQADKARRDGASILDEQNAP